MKYKKSYHCICGASFTFSDDDETVVDMLIEKVKDLHKGWGHDVTNAQRAAKIRKRIEDSRKGEMMYKGIEDGG